MEGSDLVPSKIKWQYFRIVKESSDELIKFDDIVHLEHESGIKTSPLIIRQIQDNAIISGSDNNVTQLTRVALELCDLPGCFLFILKTLGAEGLDGLEIINEPLRGLKTTKTIAKGDPILTIPFELCWTLDTCIEHPIVSQLLHKDMHMDDPLALLLLYCKFFPQSDFRTEHVQSMPQEYQNSIFWTEQELIYCKGSSLFHETQQLKEQIESDFRQLKHSLQGSFFDQVHLEDYKWALATIWSRAVDFFPEQGHVRCIVPFMDLINGSNTVPTCHMLNPGKYVQVIAGKDYDNEEIFLNYGPLSNARLARLYGFVFEDNPYDEYPLVLYTMENSPLFEQKMLLFEKYGLGQHSLFPLTAEDPLPEPVLLYLRIQRAQADELEQLHISPQKASTRNEYEILESLSAGLDQIMTEFNAETVLEAKLKQVEKHSRAYQALLVALGQLRIVKHAKRHCQERLTRVLS
ncbi:hypothetical protein EDD86DRAFT_271724 [Gorgonomyces haynaldii]|nr:hypothetical protein EDD86DRAFT_271724 [Gorgonomyces haynaldii]